MLCCDCDVALQLSATRLHEAALEQLEQKNKLLAQQLEQFALTESSALTPVSKYPLTSIVM